MTFRERFSRSQQMARRDDPANWHWRHTSSRLRGTYLGPHTDFLWEYLRRFDRRLLKRETWEVPNEAQRQARILRLIEEFPSIPADQPVRHDLRVRFLGLDA